MIGKLALLWYDFIGMKKETEKKELNGQRATFGVAGFPPNFFLSPYKNKREKIFDWLVELGLDSIELQCTYGFKMKEETALLYKKLAKERNIILTIHAPYFINLGSQNLKVVEASKNDLIKGIEFAKKIDAKKIIFHLGGGHGKTEEDRKKAILQIADVLNSIPDLIDMGEVRLFPEIGGKKNSLGSLEEVLAVCKNVKFALPCIDIAHLHAREVGSMTGTSQIERVLEKIENELGRKALEETHFHMYPIQFTEKGEKVHRAFGDVDENGDEYRPLASDFLGAIKNKKLQPSVICEAHNTQEIGATLFGKKLFFESR